MMNLTVFKYNNIEKFLKETESYLQQYEIKNTFVLTTAYQMLKEEKEGKIAAFYCGAVWNDKLELIFAILAQDNTFLYASSLFDETRPEAIDLLTKDVIKSSFNFQGLHGYQPVLNLVRDSIEAQSAMTFVKKFATLSYELKQVKWSSKIKKIAETESTSLRLASESDLGILHKWTFGFIQDAFEDPRVITQSVDSISQDMITSKGLYILCSDGIPVSMAWKVRPLRHGTSLAYVYTPNEHRNKGYGAVCVAMTSEAILRDYSYITLFVDIKRNPDDNLYTRVGYKYTGEAGRLERLT
jgi:predicted GNAT family acetyltransferase